MAMDRAAAFWSTPTVAMTGANGGMSASEAKLAETFASALAAYEMACEDALEPVDSDEEVDLLGMAQHEATAALMLIPAPDFAALAYKMAVFAVENCFNLSPEYRDPLYESLASDLLRLGNVKVVNGMPRMQRLSSNVERF